MLAHLALVGKTYRYTQSGVRLAGAGEFDRNPLRAGTLATRGQLLLQSPGFDLDAARVAFERALQLDPRDIRARLALARLHRQAGQTEVGIKMIEEGLVLRWGRRDPEALIRFRRELLHGMGDSDEARALEHQMREHREVDPEKGMIPWRIEAPREPDLQPPFELRRSTGQRHSGEHGRQI